MSTGKLVRQCCLCHLIMDDGRGKTVLLNYNVAAWAGLPVSHGYCKSCMALEREKIKAIVGAKGGIA